MTRKKSVGVQYRSHHTRPNYKVHVRNNVMFFPDPQLMESVDAEPRVLRADCNVYRVQFHYYRAYQ